MNVPDEPAHVPLYRPDVNDADIEAVVNALRSSTLGRGTQVAEFETALAETLGAEHAIAVSSGTAALHLLMVAIRLKPGDEVITTPFSYVASVNSILYVGARPVFVDIDEDSFNLDPRHLEAAFSRRTRAILPVHVFGRPCDMEGLMGFATSHKVEVIEDACEAIGARYGGRSVGTIGRAGALGFYWNKQMTTGEGGAVVTNDDEIAGLCLSLRHQGRASKSDPGGYVRLGYNYKLSDLHAALGLSQLRRLPDMIARRSLVANWYRELLADIEELILPASPAAGMEVSWFSFVVRLSNGLHTDARDHLLREMRSRGIQCANYFPSLHLQPFLQEQLGHRPGDFPVCERVASRCIALPFSSSLNEGAVERVASALKTCLFKIPRA